MLKNNKFKIFVVVLIIVFIYFFNYAVDNVHSSNEYEKFEILADAIKRSAVQCYAIEGFYPGSIKYLEDNYGLVVDHEKYVVSYDVFASNLMPDIEVYIK